MAKDKLQEKKEIPQGLYMAFKSNKGKVKSQMKLEKATIPDISSAIVWCEIVKEGLLGKYKELTGGLRWDKKDKED